jgi:hypothetical protein
MASQSDPTSHSEKPNPSRHDTNASRNYIAVARGSDLVVIRVVGKGNMVNAPALADFADEQRKAGFSRFVFDMERCLGLDSTFMGVMVGMHASVASESGSMQKIVDRPSRRTSSPAQDEPAARAASGADDDAVPMTPEEAARALNETREERDERHQRNAIAAAAAATPSLFGNEPVAPESDNAASSGVISAVNVPQNVKELMAMLGVDKFVKMRGICELGQLEMTILPEKLIPPNERRRLILKAHETLVEIDKRNEVQFGAFLKTLSAELSKE